MRIWVQRVRRPWCGCGIASGFVGESQGVVSCVRRGDAGRRLGGVVRGAAEGGMGVGVYGERMVSEMERRSMQAEACTQE